ncbi:MAG: cation diffusion facilitator family transporter [Candidatus Omnitrophica bacterium]|nr:cation diffusion facilitator family transporter [Candidatus Omnitrophota bacterium]
MIEQEPPFNRFQQIHKILLWILGLNWAVAFAKIFAGLISHCSSLTADGFHSLSDGASNIICLIGIHLASQPVDTDHPYGHKKFETLFSQLIAVLLFIITFHLLGKGIQQIKTPIKPTITTSSFVIMLVTVLINLKVMTFEQKQGKKLRSDLLIADALHTRADILTSVAVIAGLVIMKKYPSLTIVDAIITILIAIFIGYSAFGILKESTDILCDRAVMDKNIITKIVLSIPGVETCHKIRTRGRPDDIHIDLHVQVKSDMHMDKAHRISNSIEAELKKHLPGVSDVVVHMEPERDL